VVEQARYENPTICAKCGGKCCKDIPGAALPSDFDEPLIDSLTEALMSGNWMLDQADHRCNGGVDTYFPRLKQRHPNAKLTEWMDYEEVGRGPCVMLTENGCSLPYEKRPSECRLVEPNEIRCVQHAGSRWDFIEAWQPYQNEVSTALRRANDAIALR
jgi:Fe-S-cluster containining protein